MHNRAGFALLVEEAKLAETCRKLVEYSMEFFLPLLTADVLLRVKQLSDQGELGNLSALEDALAPTPDTESNQDASENPDD